MRPFLAVLFLFVAAFTARAEDKVDTVIRGKKYSTGLLQRAGGMAADTPVRRPKAVEFAGMPDSYDSVAEGFCTSVKDQGNCGSCWAHGRVAAFEAYLLSHGLAPKDIDLAEQDPLVNDKRSYGCSGGFLEGYFEVEKGVTTEALCKYKARSRFETCRGDKYAKAPKWQMIGGFNKPASAEELAWAIWQYKVLAVTVAAGSYFDPDSTGEIKRCGSRSINHIVALVGYKKLADGTYLFKIKNSWGTRWGKGGYAWSKQGCNRLASTAGSALAYTDK